MRKVLLSFLGTNSYLECNYYIDNQENQSVKKVTYIQEALVQLYCKDFTQKDVVILFLTDKAEKMNYYNDGQYNRASGQMDLPNIGLESKLKALNSQGYDFTLAHKGIREGFSNEEVWSIFETVADQIQEGDEILFDITHAFRFLPMLGIVLLNYLKTTKNVKVKGIHYGAFEKLGNRAEVEKLDSEDRNAPILDLSTLLEFQNWTSAVNSYVKFGKVSELIDCSAEELTSVLKFSKGEDTEAKSLRYITKELQELSQNLQTNRMNLLLDKDFSIFQEKLNEMSDSAMSIKPFKQILNLIKQKVQPIVTSRNLIWLEGARWCNEHNLIQQAYTQLQEGIVTFCMQWLITEPALLKIVGEDDPRQWEVALPTDKNRREQCQEILWGIYNINHGKKGENHCQALMDWLAQMEEGTPQADFAVLCEHYSHITKFRNDINHSGMNKEPSSAKKLQEKILEFINEVEQVIQRLNVT